MAFIALLSVIPILYNSCEEFSRFRKLQRPDYDNTSWNDYILVAYFTPCVFLGQMFTSRYFTNYFREKFQK